MVVNRLINDNYDVLVGDEDVLRELDSFLLSNYKGASVFILCDTNTLSECLPKLDWMELESIKDAEVLEVEPGEGSKSIEVYHQVLETLLALGADRSSILVNLGGGVISDLGGFVASTFKRGIDFVNVPTSLLAMVDASVGGKTGINSIEAKNQIGTFCEPKAVFISTVFLETLPEPELKSGIGEMVKHLLISDENALQKLDEGLFEVSSDSIATTAQVKLDLVTEDFTEQGVRKALNYGHTFGHAAESYFQEKEKSIPHGIAVLIGIVLENNLAVELKLLSKEDSQSIFSWINSNFEIEKYFTDLEVEKVLELIKFDKKNRGDSVSFSLIGPIGKCNIDVQPTLNQIEASLSFITVY